jgi:hypothetical protein
MMSSLAKLLTRTSVISPPNANHHVYLDSVLPATEKAASDEVGYETCGVSFIMIPSITDTV